MSTNNLILGIIAGDVMGSPYVKENLPGPGYSFTPFESRVSSPEYVGTGRKATAVFKTYYPTAGEATHAALFPYSSGVVRRIPGDSMGESLIGAILEGERCFRLGQDERTAKASIDKFVSGVSLQERQEGMRQAAMTAYRLCADPGMDIFTAASMKLPFDAHTSIMMSLRGGLQENERGGFEYSGEVGPNANDAFKAAVWAISTSFSYEEAVMRAIQLGGDSAMVGAVTGGLAELKFPDSPFLQMNSERILSYLDEEQLESFKNYEAYLAKDTTAVEQQSAELHKANTPVRILGLSGHNIHPVFAVPEDREDIADAIKAQRPDAIVVTPERFSVLRRRIAEHRGVDASGQPLGGVYIAASHPEQRTFYYSPQNKRIFSPSTFPKNLAISMPEFSPDETRLSQRSAWENFAKEVREIRDTQERLIEHNPEDGHLCFDSAWWVDIERDRIYLMKGTTRYGSFGLNEYGRLHIDTNVKGGTLVSGDRLRGALDNLEIFNSGDTYKTILPKLREKLLDEGVSADAITNEQVSVYEKPEGEEKIYTNYELMQIDIRSAKSDFPREIPFTDELIQSFVPQQTFYAATSEAKSLTEAIRKVANKGVIFTLGTSTHDLNEFIGLLKEHGIGRIVDVRSLPYSKMYPHFNRESLDSALKQAGIEYDYEGELLGGHVLGGSSVTFSESEGAYSQRTRENASDSDITIAIAVDYSTAGEKCTLAAARGKYLQCPIAAGMSEDELKELGRSLAAELTEEERSRGLKVNIAGNGIYTLAEHGITQQTIDEYLVTILSSAQESGFPIESVISGGQTGVDEAGIHAAVSLGLPAHIHAPKGWQYRDAKGNDRKDEVGFKSRFSEELTYAENLARPQVKEALAELVREAGKGVRLALVSTESQAYESHRFAELGYAIRHADRFDLGVEPILVQHIAFNGKIYEQEYYERRLCRDYKVNINEPEFHEAMAKKGESLRAPSKEQQEQKARRFKQINATERRSWSNNKVKK